MEKIIEEFLTAEQLQTYTTGEHVYNCIEIFISQNEIPMTKIIVASCDGAPEIMRKNRGFLAVLKKKIPVVMTVHCI